MECGGGLTISEDAFSNSQPQLPFLTNAAGKPVARVTPGSFHFIILVKIIKINILRLIVIFSVTSVGADATPPKPKPPLLTPKPAPSEIVKRLSFKRDTAPDPSLKRDPATQESSFKRDPAPDVEDKRDVSIKKESAAVNDEKTTSNATNNNDTRRRMEDQKKPEVKTESKVGGFLDEPPDKPPPKPPNANEPNDSNKVFLLQFTKYIIIK